jgi:hypothetical protein
MADELRPEFSTAIIPGARPARSNSAVALVLPQVIRDLTIRSDPKGAEHQQHERDKRDVHDRHQPFSLTISRRSWHRGHAFCQSIIDMMDIHSANLPGARATPMQSALFDRPKLARPAWVSRM